MITITIIQRRDLNRFPDNLPLSEVTVANLMLGAKTAFQRASLFVVESDGDFYVMKDTMGLSERSVEFILRKINK